MTTWTVGHTDRFSAAIIGAPVSDHVSMRGHDGDPRVQRLRGRVRRSTTCRRRGSITARAPAEVHDARADRASRGRPALPGRAVGGDLPDAEDAREGSRVPALSRRVPHAGVPHTRRRTSITRAGRSRGSTAMAGPLGRCPRRNGAERSRRRRRRARTATGRSQAWDATVAGAAALRSPPRAREMISATPHPAQSARTGMIGAWKRASAKNATCTSVQ